MTTESHYDLIAVGGGSGGLAVTQRAAEYGARVALIEPGRLGGTCVNAGCVPKKILWHAVHLMEGARAAAGYGIELPPARADWGQMRRQRDAYIARLNGVYARNLDQRGVTHMMVTPHSRIRTPCGSGIGSTRQTTSSWRQVADRSARQSRALTWA
jgi:glutathione reductase (NADPH)